MVLRCQPVANVMQQRADNPVNVRTVAFGPRCRLQSMRHKGDPVIFQCRLVLTAQFVQNAFSCQRQIGFFQFLQKVIVIGSAILYLDKANG